MRRFVYPLAGSVMVLAAMAILFGNSRALTIAAATATWVAIQPVIIAEMKRARPCVRR